MWNKLKDDHVLMPEKALELLSNTALIAYVYFLASEKKINQGYVSLTFDEAKKYNVCRSRTTFIKAKKELIIKGFLDVPVGDRLGNRAIFKLSNRWENLKEKYNVSNNN